MTWQSYGTVALAGFLAFIIYRIVISIRARMKEGSEFKKTIDDIMTSDEHKVKGRFEA